MWKRLGNQANDNTNIQQNYFEISIRLVLSYLEINKQVTHVGKDGWFGYNDDEIYGMWGNDLHRSSKKYVIKTVWNKRLSSLHGTESTSFLHCKSPRQLNPLSFLYDLVFSILAASEDPLAHRIYLIILSLITFEWSILYRIVFYITLFKLLTLFDLVFSLVKRNFYEGCEQVNINTWVHETCEASNKC